VILPGEGGLSGTLFGATELKIGYAQLSTVDQDLTVQREALAALGVDPKRICVDHGLTGTNRERPGLRQALAACHGGDMLVVTKLDRLARSVPDPRDIADELGQRRAYQYRPRLDDKQRGPRDHSRVPRRTVRARPRMQPRRQQGDRRKLVDAARLLRRRCLVRPRDLGTNLGTKLCETARNQCDMAQPPERLTPTDLHK